jgi:hypothetical protein
MQDRSPPARRNHLQRTAGPYMWVIRVVLTVASHFRLTPINRRSQAPSACFKRANFGIGSVVTARNEVVRGRRRAANRA